MLILKIRQVADVEFNGIEKVHEGAFINRYNLTYTTKDNKKKVMSEITDAVGLSKDGRGICFSIPVDNVVGLQENIIFEKK